MRVRSFTDVDASFHLTSLSPALELPTPYARMYALRFSRSAYLPCLLATKVAMWQQVSRIALIAAQLGGQAKSSPRPALGLSCSPLIRTL